MSIIGPGEREFDSRDGDKSRDLEHTMACHVRDMASDYFDHVVLLSNDDGHGARVIAADDDQPNVRYLFMVIEQEV